MNRRLTLARGVAAAIVISAAWAACGDSTVPVAAPVVRLIPPPDSVVYAGEPVALTAEATEGGQALPPGSIRWLVDEEQVATGESVSVRLDDPGQHVVAVEAVGSTGLTARDAVGLDVLANSPPVLHEARVCCSSAAYIGDTLRFTANAVDVEHGVLDGASVTWTSDRDGPLGQGDSLQILAEALSLGAHTVTVRAADPAGNADSLFLTLDVGAPPPGLLWSRILGDGRTWTFQSDLLAADDAGNLYVGLQGSLTLRALDAAGRTRWTYDLPWQLWDHSSGLTVAPDGTVYVFDFHGNGAALSPEGGLRWAALLLGQDPHGRFALAPTGELYAAGTDRLVRVDPSTGAILWTSPLGGYLGGPAVAPDGRVVSHLGFAVLVTDPDGQVLFNQALAGPAGPVRTWYMSSMGADGTSYFQRDALSAVTLEGTVAWQVAVGQPRAEPVVAADGRVFTFTRDGAGQVAVALSGSGIVLWQQPLTGDSYIPRLALLADETLLAMTGPNLHRLDAATGAVLGTTTFPTDIATAPVVKPDGTILLMTNDHRLVALQGWAGLAPDAPWPTWRRDNRRTAAVPAPPP